MPRTIYVSVRGDGSWRVLESFRGALGEEAKTLVIHPNRDDSGFYGSAEVNDVAAAREAFAVARQPYPGLKAHLSAPPPEREGSPPQPQQGQSRRQSSQRAQEGASRPTRHSQSQQADQAAAPARPASREGREHRGRVRGRRRPAPGQS